jgi:prepilin-type N-terminal cleavage/methylation domain-containing protein
MTPSILIGKEKTPFYRNILHNKYGLSLIELLTTVVIMGILATAAIPLGEVVFTRDKEIDLKRALFKTRRAIDRFHADNGSYPISFEDLRWYWKNNTPYLRQCPPLNPFANSHEAWILILKNNLDKDAPQLTNIPYREKMSQSRYLAYGIYDIRVPDPRRAMNNPAAPTESTDPNAILQGYFFVDAPNFRPYFRNAMYPYMTSLDGSFYSTW